jgi:hypothetical protein
LLELRRLQKIYAGRVCIGDVSLRQTSTHCWLRDLHYRVEELKALENFIAFVAALKSLIIRNGVVSVSKLRRHLQVVVELQYQYEVN